MSWLKPRPTKPWNTFFGFFLCVPCALCGECFSRFNTENTEATEGTEKEKRVVARVPDRVGTPKTRFRHGDFLMRAAKFSASEEAGYSSFDAFRQGQMTGGR
jgi:hypothetical protein